MKKNKIFIAAIAPLITTTPFFSSCSQAQFDLPILQIFGSLQDISKEKAVNVQIKYTDLLHKYDFNADAKIKWQGRSSLVWPKKNYNITLYEPNTDFEDKMDVLVNDRWTTAHNQYTLKANFNDSLLSHNIVSSLLYGDIVKERNIPDRFDSIYNGGGIDGFPIQLVINNRYIGLYDFNLKKDKYLFDMKGSDPSSAILFAGDITRSTRFKEPINPDLSNGWEIEFCSTKDDDSWVVQSFNNFINFVINNDGDAFKQGIGNFIDVRRAIDYLIYVNFGYMYDNVTNNTMWVTYDGGQKWYPAIYDLDASWGYSYLLGYQPINADANSDFSLLFQKIRLNFWDDIVTRYHNLRSNILSDSHIINSFKVFNDQLPKNLLRLENKLWPSSPWRKINTIDNLENWVRARGQYFDKIIK